ncbi:hypothetical protein CHS0354_020772 [Potamilus streckersoni]|uniref:Uncharacterized protein n=1 Tax=Potamilus streckersoni TaxID=2493646 RepID=A0AAE0SCP6_9BIVA|nr:hypothetical protein CHS0354_020772 [Potamilus streckersoni]
MDLPSLNEGDETISLADILVARDSCLTEDELWALCRECCLVLEVVNNSPEMFQTLCVTPDTVAFDQMGNVCFLDLDIDPEPIYIPPEYDNVGNSYKAHLFSLGMTLLYAAEYNADSSRPEINLELRDILGRMTLENYSSRPDLDSVIVLCEEQLCGQSSQEVCCTIAQFSGFPHPDQEDVSSQSMPHVPDDIDLTQTGERNLTPEDISQASACAQFSEPGDSQPSWDSDSDMDKRSQRKVSPQVTNGLWVSSTPSKSKSKLKSVDDKYGSEYSSTRKGSATSADLLESDIAVADLYNEYNYNSIENNARKYNSGTNFSHEDQMSNSGKYSDISSNTLSQNGLDEVLEKDHSQSKHNSISDKSKRKESLGTADSLLQSVDGSDVGKKGSNEVESSDSSSLTTSKKKRKRLGLTIGEVLNAVDRPFEEEELWALCKEGITSLQRKKKHLPAYLSPDTIFLRENGTVSFKAIPEEKPLEVIFMAPELQSDGELSEKTCLYGLSVTLRCVAGKKYSSISSMPTSQELKNLLESLSESNPSKRPNLSDVAELCVKQEIKYEKKLSTVCQKIFQEAMDIMFEQEEKEGKENESNKSSSQIGKENMSGISAVDSPANEYSMPVLAKPSAIKPSAIKPSAIKPSAFKPVSGSAFQSVNGGSIGSDSGAFQPIPRKAQQNERVEEPRLPSAFSSPATHFKPIILHQPEAPKEIKVESSKKEESVKKESASKRKEGLNQPNDKDKEVFKKLDELKKNLMKHGRQPNMAKEIENEDLADSLKSSKESTSKSSTPSKPKTKSRKSERMYGKDQAPNGALETLLKEIQKQGHIPDTQSLANTIAQYLQSQLVQGETERAQSKSSDTKSVTSEQNPGEVSNLHSPHQNTPTQSHLPQAMINQFSNLNIPAQYQPQLVGQTITLPMQYGGNVFPGYTQVQLQQDPITGFFNLVPVNFMPVNSHSNQGHDAVSVDSVVKLGRSSPLMPLEGDHAGNYGKSKTLGHGRTAKDLLQRTANIRAKNMGRFPGQTLSVQSENANLWRSRSDYALEKSDSAFYSDREGIKQSYYSSRNKHTFSAVNNDSLVDVHNRTHQSLSPHAIPPYDPHSREPQLYRTHSNSSSPSPSKDSGVSGMNVGYKNVPSGMEASLMDRLLSNVNIKHQKMLGKIVNLLRDEFAFDGYMENGVEDLAMAEYIASLGMLKMDTFISAISEKYSDLYWNPELLVNLYEAVNGAKPKVHEGRLSQQHSGTFSRTVNYKPPVRNKLHTRQHLHEDFDSSSMSESSDHQRSVRNVDLLHSLIKTGNHHGRPQSVHALGHHVDTSDSTDTEQYEKRRKLKKKYQLDRVKSSSMHNLLSDSSYLGQIDINIQSGNIFVAKAEGTTAAQFGQDTVNPSNGNKSVPKQQNSTEPDLTSTPNAKRASDSGQILDISVKSQAENEPLTLFSTTSMNQNEMLKTDTLNNAQSKPVLPLSAIPSAPSVLTVTSSSTMHLDSESVSTLFREMSVSSKSSSQSGVRNLDNGSIDTVAKTPIKHKGHVVYHWAMIQLSMTPDVERFMQDIDEENAKMLDSRLSSIEQQIKMEKKVRRKTQMFYKKLKDSTAKSSKGDKNTLTQVVKDITDMTHRISFQELCKTHLEMLQAELQGIDVSYLYSIATCPPGSPMQLRPRPDNPLLQFQTIRETTSGCEIQAIHAGTPEGLMAYLFASTALSDGYIHQFLFCFRYFVKAEDVLNFLIDRFTSAKMVEGNEVNLFRLQQRVIDYFHFWLEGYYSIDFEKNHDLLLTLENFIEDKMSTDFESYKTLTALLSNCRHGHNLELSTADTSEQEIHFWHREEKHKQSQAEKIKEWESFKSLVRGKSHTNKDRPGHPSSGGTVCIERRRHSLALTNEELFHPKVMRRTDTFTLIDYSAQVLAEQLTLIQQGMFQLAHPVHYLDSKSRGIGVEMAHMGLRTPSLGRANRDSGQNIPEVESRSLFVSLRVDSPVIKQMIEHSQQISHWVAAEVVTCSNAKSQVIVLTRVLQTAQICMELRNFATCISILDGLENVIVKQLPVWKNLSNKCLSIMEELSALKMVLKNDPLSLMQHVKDCHLYPTIPSILLFLLHVQQLEIGGFQFANQMFKWGKIRSLAQVIDQIRIFREHVYCFEARYELQDTLQHRIRELCRQEIHIIAAQNDFNFQKLTGGGISGALRKVRGKFQLKTDR